MYWHILIYKYIHLPILFLRTSWDSILSPIQNTIVHQTIVQKSIFSQHKLRGLNSLISKNPRETLRSRNNKGNFAVELLRGHLSLLQVEILSNYQVSMTTGKKACKTSWLKQINQDVKEVFSIKLHLRESREITVRCEAANCVCTECLQKRKQCFCTFVEVTVS